MLAQVGSDVSFVEVDCSFFELLSFVKESIANDFAR